MTTDLKLSFSVSLTRGLAPDLSNAFVDARTILDGLPTQPAGTAFVTGLDGRDYAYVFPTLFYSDPQLPGLEYVRSGNGAFELSRVLPDVTMGSGRDFAVINHASSGVPSFVMVDHGSEYSAGGYESWPFGHVWVATDKGNGFAFEQVSDIRAFNHAVDTGDLNHDNRVDIVSSHMGVKEGGVYTDLHAYLQQPDGSFVQDRGFASVISGSWGSGAVALANIDQINGDEVIQVNYLPIEGSTDWGGIRILARSDSGDYRIDSVLPREGLFKTMGATRVVPVDYDLDSDLDLVLSFEGQYVSFQGHHPGNGLEIYENDGQGGFTRATDELMKRNSWSSGEMQFREFEVVDFDGDGYQDIILNGWNGAETQLNQGWNLASQMFRNIDGKQFIQMSSAGASGLTLVGLAGSTAYIRVIDVYDSGPELFAMQKDGAPVTVRIEADYRNFSERLNAAGIRTHIKGFAGDDSFEVTGSELFLDGGAGLDTVLYNFSITDATLSRNGDEWMVKKVGAAIDTLMEIERLFFSDATVALDTDGVAGQAYRIYKAAFDRVPDLPGLGYWINDMDGGTSLTTVATGFIASEEFQSRYGSVVSDHDFITLLYANVLDRTPDQQGLDYWINDMKAGMSRAAVLASFSESDENQLNVVGLIANGIEYTPFII